MKKTFAFLAIAAAFSAVNAQEAETPTFASTCKVQHDNGYVGTANCHKSVAVITKVNTLMCVPRADIVNKDGKWLVFASPKQFETVTPCKDGMKVKS